MLSVNYKIILKKDNVALVEWRDARNNLRRSVLPKSVVEHGDLADDQLRAGIPYGAMWESILGGALGEQLARALREQNIWTYADAANHIREFRAIVNEIVVASLLNAARQGGIHE